MVDATTQSPGYLTLDGGFTAEIWFWASAAPSSWSALVYQMEQGPAWMAHWSFEFNTTGQLNISAFQLDHTNMVELTGERRRVTTTDPVNDSAWHHAAIVMLTDKKTIRAFLDGQFIGTATGSNVLDWSTDVGAKILIGGVVNPDTGSYKAGFNGRLAYFAGIDYALPDYKIAEHYAAGAGATVFYGEDECARMNRFLDWAEVPYAARCLQPAQSTLEGVDPKGVAALAAVQDPANDAGGYVFADGQSIVTYHNRQHRLSRWSVATLSESLGLGPGSNITFESDDSWIYNDITGDRPYGTKLRVQSQASIESYGRKTYSITLGITSQTELQNALDWLLYRYQEHHIRISQVSLDLTSSTAWDLALSQMEIGDRLVLDELPANAPDTTFECLVEGLSVSGNKDSGWKVTFNLSPGDQDYAFQLDTTADEWWGALDTGGVLAY